MIIRSGKIQYLFWASLFSTLIYIWLISIGIQTFVLNKSDSLNPPTNIIILMFVLAGLSIVLELSGIVISIMIDNKFYRNFFGVLILLSFIALLSTRAIFG